MCRAQRHSVRISVAEADVTRPSLAIVVLGFTALPLAAFAHHSWRAVYDGGEDVRITATITSEVYRNPHQTVRAELAYRGGEPEEWTIEWRGGRPRDGEPPIVYDLDPGDRVVIEGRIARFPGARKLQMFTLKRPADGMTIEARRSRNRDRS